MRVKKRIREIPRGKDNEQEKLREEDSKRQQNFNKIEIIHNSLELNVKRHLNGTNATALSGCCFPYLIWCNDNNKIEGDPNSIRFALVQVQATE